MAFAKEGLLLLSSARSWPVGQGSSCNLTLGPGVCLQVTGLTKKYQHMQCKQALSKHVIAFNSFQPCSGTSTGATTSVHGCWWAHVWPASSCQRTLWPCTGTTCRDNHAWSYIHRLVFLIGKLGLLHLVENMAERACDLWRCLLPSFALPQEEIQC